MTSHCCIGYAIVNFVTHNDAARCVEVFQSYSDWSSNDNSVCEAMWSVSDHGLGAHVQQFTANREVPDEWKPAYFVDGAQVPFPEPIGKVKAPKMKNTRNKGKPAH